MKIRRYYLKQKLELAKIQGIHGVLVAVLKWQIAKHKFVLYYPGEEVEVYDVGELGPAVRQRGAPVCVFGSFTSAACDTLEIETCGRDEIVMAVDGRSGTPDEVFAQVEPMLGLKRVTEATVARTINSAFIAHAFDEEGRQCASEVSRFLQLLGIKNESGKRFSPKRISDKVRERLATHDMFVAIVTPQKDPTWLIQECTAAQLSKKPIVLLKQEDARFKPGLLGDLEFIPFPKGQISKTFVHILEGVRASAEDEAIEP